MEKGNQPSELQFLNLEGKLNVRHLERVENHMDAKIANLCKKENLRELRLEWECYNRSKKRENMVEKVLEALEPHPNLKSLGIDGFNGRYFPQWLRNSCLVNLVEFGLENCPNCSGLPQFGQLPHLKIMHVRDLGLEYIVQDGSPVITNPSLEVLTLHFLPYLQGFAKEKELKAFPRLHELYIVECSSLILPPLTPLKELGISKSSNLTVISKPENHTSLHVYNGNIPNEVLENLPNLESLKIYEAHENSLSAQGLLGMKSLESLNIFKSDTLRCLPRGRSPYLTTLRELCIGWCPEFVELPEDIQCLKYPTFLHLISLPKMVSLPAALEHLPSPYSLQLNNLTQLASLSACLRSFTSLRALTIFDCPKLISLPQSIKEMRNLEDFSIDGCPELERRCKKETGEDWHKIAHLRHVK